MRGEDATVGSHDDEFFVDRGFVLERRDNAALAHKMEDALLNLFGAGEVLVGVEQARRARDARQQGGLGQAELGGRFVKIHPRRRADPEELVSVGCAVEVLLEDLAFGCGFSRRIASTASLSLLGRLREALPDRSNFTTCWV